MSSEVRQTVFDEMMLNFEIDLGQHQAAHKFMDAIGRSGMAIPSLAIDPDDVISSGSARRNADKIADRRMIFSAAYRHMSEDASDRACKTVMSLCHSPYVEIEEEARKEAASLINAALWSLARYYGISRVRDPRRIIRSQLYRN